ncbi:PadR family transcriptional regulator [Methanoplanus endosymbiosus]|uniref:Helix-turn-helix transcriptional regulator n=1 Tax=Methanoplanus endosymbiosus TaxID=33865 RepID=A0A9E7PQC5_9EURY|nr:helix-turn-helix transcriptional regulator [Methanoplanus endosymbiosus]UUX93041.1 helix-turn-helix transcriptional regulator [Methanoplanus endosymbiosus]
MRENVNQKLNKKIILLNDFFSEDILYFYGDSADKYSIFTSGLEHGLTNSELCLYGFYHTQILTRFNEDIQQRRMEIFELRNGIDNLIESIEKCCDRIYKSNSLMAFRFLFDFSKVKEIENIILLKNIIHEKKEQSFPISGIYAFNIKSLKASEISRISKEIPRVIMETNDEHLISFPIGRNNPGDSENLMNMVDQNIVEDVIRKSLDTVIISLLNRPMSGLDIIREIQTRFGVIIPMTRVYSYLLELEYEDVLSTHKSGNKKIYTPTKTGKITLDKRREDTAKVYAHILNGG